MSRVYFTSDWHLQHRAILKYRPEFRTVEAHNQTLIDNFNKVVGKRDTVYFLGDIVFEEEGLEIIKNLQHCRKILFLGNHDYVNTAKLLTVFDQINGLRSLKNFWLSHAPIHPQELRGRIGNIHGHLHRSILQDDEHRYFDVSPEKHNYELVPFEDIKSYFKGLQDGK